MPKKRVIKDCVEVRICISDDFNERIERYKALRRLKGIDLKKHEAVIDLIERGLTDCEL